MNLLVRIYIIPATSLNYLLKSSIAQKRQANQHEIAKATKWNLLLDFVLADKSEWHTVVTKGEKDKIDKMQTLISSISTENLSQKHSFVKMFNVISLK